jgi:signal peptidase I
MKWIRIALWAALAPGAAVLVLSFFCGVYRVDSASMEPTLHGSPEDGDLVLVWFERSPELKRFDLVVLERGDADEGPLVKRVVGLPGETIQLASGDLYVGRSLLPPEAPRPPLVPIFDDRVQDFSEAFYVEPAQATRWLGTVTGRRLDARGARDVRAKLRRLNDDHLAPDGTPNGKVVHGRSHANDAAVTFSLEIDEPWQRFFVDLTEEGDTFVCELVPASEGRATVRLVRRATQGRDPGDPQTLDVTEVAFERGRPHAFRFANLDNLLTVEVDRTLALKVSYAANTALRSDGNSAHVLPRLEIGGDDVVAQIDGLAVWRDTPYYDSGEFASGRPETLAPYELFVIGDNSGESRDSRQWGPVPLQDVLGTPVAIVWPPSRWRRLRPTELPGTGTAPAR